MKHRPKLKLSKVTAFARREIRLAAKQNNALLNGLKRRPDPFFRIFIIAVFKTGQSRATKYVFR